MPSSEVVESAIERVMDLLAPRSHGKRCPIFEWGHEATPTEEEVQRLAHNIVLAVLEQKP